MFIIDRFEGDIAVIEYEKGKFFNLPRFLIPGEASEGDSITIEIKIDEDAAHGNDERIRTLIEELFEDEED